MFKVHLESGLVKSVPAMVQLTMQCLKCNAYNAMLVQTPTKIRQALCERCLYGFKAVESIHIAILILLKSLLLAQ